MKTEALYATQLIVLLQLNKIFIGYVCPNNNCKYKLRYNERRCICIIDVVFT